MSLNDQYMLSRDATFKQRVTAAVLGACVAIANEGWSVVWHRERATFAAQILSSAGSAQSTYMTLFSNSVAVDATCIGDATANSTVTLTSANVAAQAALVTDTHISNAVSAQFNSFIKVPAV